MTFLLNIENNLTELRLSQMFVTTYSYEGIVCQISRDIFQCQVVGLPICRYSYMIAIEIALGMYPQGPENENNSGACVYNIKRHAKPQRYGNASSSLTHLVA